MSNIVEIKVPDIGDFADVDVIEVLVSPGDSIAQEDALMTLESDKATMEIPSPQAGTVQSVDIAIGDKINKGDVIVSLEPAETEQAEAAQQDSGESCSKDQVHG